MQSLKDKANSTTENSALRARCTKAEAEVAKLQGVNEILKQMSAEQEVLSAPRLTRILLRHPHPTLTLVNLR